MTTTTSRYPAWLMKLAAPPNSADDEAHSTRRSIEQEERQQGRYQQPNDSAFNKAFSINIDVTHSKETGYHDQAIQRSPHHQASARPAQPQTQAQRNANDTELLVKMLRRLFTEFLGTFMLVWLIVVAAVEFNLTNTGQQRGPAALNQGTNGLAGGITLSFLIWSMGHISGAHFNPCVTWAFALRRIFPWRWVLPYWLAQFVGSLLAGAFVRAFYYNEAYLGTNVVPAQYHVVTAMFYESVLTFIFIFTVLALASKGGNVGPEAALADGFALAVMLMIGASYTGTSCNPFRSLGQGIINGPREDLWVFVAGPFIGATCSVLAVWIMHGAVKKSDLNAAQGKGEAEDN